ncbi:cardiolipin synthase ClsB [Dickeya dianthicola]|uniref:cardiolipin synthase ClsB n=1 Tax=Dickeya dianthicola TaxID=204039 RepID=UPI00136A76A0|nr:cardiolipin synthase ClsB [Dickeya dianthicola]MCI4255831.1 cardiolipin synthase ClsB [Dickeya dianthicola]MZG22087.1 cardiolipin synthase ClsB [Dickeya dianthicola]MZI87874.1 cardiolipin synthase ClsB [Dickeya dianthicola]
MKTEWRDGNQIELLVNGDEFYPSVFDAIRQARSRVVLETFIWFEDKVGYALREALIAAARRGVSVDATADGYGSRDLSPDFLAPLVEAGVRFHFYDPLPRLFGLMRTNLFRRLHRKIVVVDGHSAWIGGINYSADHLSDYGPQAKQDYAVKVRGPVVDDIGRFVLAALAHHEEPRVWWRRRFRRAVRNTDPGNAQALFVWRDNGPHRRDIERQYLQMLRRAKREVVIANAYFFPGYRLLRAMRKAARRDVRVRLIIQGQPDMPIVLIGARLLYPWLVKAGVDIYEYRRQPLHGKVALQDDHWTTVGSSNLDPLSLALNLEANLFINDRDFNQQLQDNLHQLIREDCVRVDPTQLPKRSYWQVVKGMVVFHFLKRFPSMVGWLPAPRPQLTRVEHPPMDDKDRK